MEHRLRILRRPELTERTGLSNAQRDRLEAAGKFPKRVKLSERAVGWYEHEVDEFLAGLPRGDAAAGASARFGSQGD
jgi:prophage regulatory protein